MKFIKTFSLMVGLVASINSVNAGEDEDTPMEKSMTESSRGLKDLRRIPEGDWAALAAGAKKANESFLKSMQYSAKLIEDMEPGKEKDLALADSRRLLGLCYTALCELEIAYLKEDQEGVDAATDKWKALKKEGHKLYTE